MARYEMTELPASDIEFLEAMGAKRGCLRGGGRVDLEKVSSILINEYRAGMLGNITLETPAMVSVEEKIVAEQQAEKAKRDAARKKNRKNKKNR